MEDTRILLTESRRFAPEALELLRSVGEVQLGDLDRPALLREAAQADILWVRLRHHIDAEVMAAAPRLRVIVTATTGLNHINLEEAEARGITVLSLRGESDFLSSIRSTAEHTLVLALALVRHLPEAVCHAREGGWNRDRFWGNELYGKTAGVVGYGRLGRIVARYFHALGMRILAADPHVPPNAFAPEVIQTPLDKLLPESDLVTLHVNLVRETTGLLGRREFGLMKPGAWFINTARGELIDESALLDGLRARHLAGAALDVITGEHAGGMDQHPLTQYARQHSNLLITPHIGGCAYESVEKTEIFMARKVLNWLRQRKTAAPSLSVP